ncbi:MAG: TIGR00269 family protein [Thermoplasmata archaeon]|nr:TIGR00269 family protein [Thermoplasmata archaeon]
MRCAFCTAEAIVDRPYAGDHLCGDHLGRSIADRFRREMRRQAPRMRSGRVAVALSGGKDSATALVLTRRYFERRPTVELVAISVDEGIAGYRPSTLAKAQELTAQLGVEHRIVRAESALGVTTDQAVERLPGTVPCSFCGVWRRGLLNEAAREAEAELLVLGFNLDDLAQSILMNLAHAEVDRLLRMAPHRKKQPGLVPRIAPLATVPEREIFLHALANGIPFDHSECPHARAAERNVFREVLWRLEEVRPGTRHALLRTRETIADLLERNGGEGAPSRCSLCGAPSTHAICRSCEYRRAAAEAVVAE